MSGDQPIGGGNETNNDKDLSLSQRWKDLNALNNAWSTSNYKLDEIDKEKENDKKNVYSKREPYIKLTEGTLLHNVFTKYSCLTITVMLPMLTPLLYRNMKNFTVTSEFSAKALRYGVLGYIGLLTGASAWCSIYQILDKDMAVDELDLKKDLSQLWRGKQTGSSNTNDVDSSTLHSEANKLQHAQSGNNRESSSV